VTSDCLAEVPVVQAGGHEAPAELTVAPAADELSHVRDRVSPHPGLRAGRGIRSQTLISLCPA